MPARGETDSIAARDHGLAIISGSSISYDADLSLPISRELFTLEEEQIRTATLPFLQRGGDVCEVAAIRGLPRDQVHTVAILLRGNRELPEQTPIQMRAEERRTAEFDRALVKNGGLTVRQKNCYAFAAKAADTGLLPENLNIREFLVRAYSEGRRRIPSSVAEQVRLEAYVAMMESNIAGSVKEARDYRSLGGEVDPAWFTTHLNADERFLTEQILSPERLIALCSSLRPIVFGRLRRYGLPLHFAEDVLQTAVIRMHSNVADFDPTKGKFLSYLRTVVTNIASDTYRVESIRPKDSYDAVPELMYHLREESKPLDVIQYEEDIWNAFNLAVDTLLTPVQQESIRLRYMHGMSDTQISAYLGIPMGTVKARIYTSLHKLRQDEVLVDLFESLAA